MQQKFLIVFDLESKQNCRLKSEMKPDIILLPLIHFHWIHIDGPAHSARTSHRFQLRYEARQPLL